MDFKNVVRERRSVRKFSDKLIPEDILKEIIEDATWAPSAVNVQPWYFVVAQSKEAKDSVLSMMNEVSDKTKEHLYERFSNHIEVANNTLQFIKSLGNSQVIVLVFTGKKIEDYPLLPDGVIQSVSASIQNLILSAYNHGIGSCWMTAPGQAKMNKEFREKFAPEHGDLVAMVVLGYPDENYVAKAPVRKDDRYKFI